LDAALFLVIYVCFTAYLVSLVRQQVTAAERQESQAEVRELTPDGARPRVWVCLALLVCGVALLAGGAHSTVMGAVGLARILGWSERVIGLTIVSAGTGLPEVVASLVSSIRGRSDVAIGNVIGSNLFNTLGVLGITSIISPLPVSPALISQDCWWMLGVTLLLFPLMFTGSRLSRWEGAGLFAVYCIYIAKLLSTQS
jgi:cation:H+ antiporter